MGGGPESRCVGRVSGAEGAVRRRRHLPHRTESLQPSHIRHIAISLSSENTLKNRAYPFKSQ